MKNISSFFGVSPILNDLYMIFVGGAASLGLEAEPIPPRPLGPNSEDDSKYNINLLCNPIWLMIKLSNSIFNILCSRMRVYDVT